MNEFYDDYTKLVFHTDVLECLKDDENYWIGTNTTSFFVEGGGMASDRGTLNGYPVRAMKFENNRYYHLVDKPLEGKVEGIVDYKQRLFKVQVHTSQHLISALLGLNYNLETISHHVSSDDNYIEFSGNNNEVDIKTLQDKLNDYLIGDLPVTVSYPSIEEASKYAVAEKLNHEELRVVQIGELDYNLCGCIHVKRLGEIGLIFIKSWEKTKTGGIIHYLAGKQIIEYLNPRLDQLNQATKLLALDHLTITSGIEKLQKENKDLNYRLQGYKQEKLEQLATTILEKKEETVLELEDFEVKDGQFFISYLNNQGFDHKVGLLLKLAQERCHVLISGPDNLETFNHLATKFNLKGGGNSKVAQGGGDYQEGIIVWLNERIK